MAERAAAPAPRAGQETGCATTGDHRDFAGAASAEGASQASRRAEMDIRLRMAVYGLALSPLAVDVRRCARGPRCAHWLAPRCRDVG